MPAADPGLPVWTPGLWASTVWEDGVWASPSAPVISYSSPVTLPLDTPASLSPTNSGGASTDWTVSAGALPTGLSLNAISGVISGTPTVEGDFNATIQATNVGGSDTFDISITVSSITERPKFRYDSPYIGYVNTDVGTLSPTNTGGASSDWEIYLGNLPRGLSFNTSNGDITGIPLQTGSFTIHVKATNIIGVGNRAVKIVVREPKGKSLAGGRGDSSMAWALWERNS